MKLAAVIKLWLAIRPIKRLRRFREMRKIRKLSKELTMDTIMQSLKSKTVWFGIATEVWGLVQVFLADGTFTTEAFVSLVSGAIIVVLRAVTTKPLSHK